MRHVLQVSKLPYSYRSLDIGVGRNKMCCGRTRCTIINHLTRRVNMLPLLVGVRIKVVVPLTFTWVAVLPRQQVQRTSVTCARSLLIGGLLPTHNALASIPIW